MSVREILKFFLSFPRNIHTWVLLKFKKDHELYIAVEGRWVDELESGKKCIKHSGVSRELLLLWGKTEEEVEEAPPSPHPQFLTSVWVKQPSSDHLAHFS